MSTRPWMPLYVADFQADTLDLGTAEVGVYLALLMIAWRRDDAAIPNDMEWLKRSLQRCFADFHGHHFNRIVPKLLQRYFKLTGDKWRNKRLTKERQTAAKFSAKQRQNANKRWHKTNKNNDIKNATVNAKAIPLHSHSHSHSQREEDTANAVPSSATTYAFESGIIRLSEKDFSKWQHAFSHLDLGAELTGLAEWANQQGSRWFFAVAGALAKRNRTVKTSLEKRRTTPAEQDWKEALA